MMVIRSYFSCSFECKSQFKDEVVKDELCFRNNYCNFVKFDFNFLLFLFEGKSHVSASRLSYGSDLEHDGGS